MKPLPTTERGRRSRTAIVAAAAELMHDRGLAAPSIDEVLAASGAGKSQLYHYFESRRDLSVAVLHHQFERVMAAQPSLTDPGCDDLGRWRDEVLHAQRTHGMNTCPLGVFVGQTDADPMLRDTLDELFTRWQRAISDLVARARQAGRIRRDADPDAAALALLTAHQGGTLLSHLRQDVAPLADAIDAAIGALGAGVR
jgi:AcrR family transcriptional regulator